VRLPQARRDSNPQPPVLETGALPIELRTSTLLQLMTNKLTSGQGRNRTTDTTIFSRVLYQLSYLAKKIRPGPFGFGRIGKKRAL
jgi:hypothetical protein